MQDTRVNVRFKDEHGNVVGVRRVSAHVESELSAIVKTGLQMLTIGAVLLLLKYMAITLLAI